MSLRSPRVLRALGVLIVAVAMGAGLMQGAVADPVTVADARLQLDQLEEEQSSLNLRIAESEQRLQTVQAQLAQTEASIVDQRSQVDAAREQMAQIALQQYQTRGIESTAVFLVDDVSKMLDQISTVERVTETTNSMLREYQLQQSNLSDLERSQQAALASIAESQAELAALEAESEVKVKEAQTALLALTARAMAASSNGIGLSDPTLAVPNPSSGFVWPSTGSVSSQYGGRIHPIYGSYAFHDGLDLANGCGTPTVAVANGVVTDAYYGGGYGNRLFVDNGIINGHHVVTSYNHLQGFATTVGQTVSQGEVVAYMGTTGASTGCHLHFMVWVDGTLVDPMNFLS
ncbi:MAG: peptidoglycan DD-metalloendopeptidase family protein [Propionibacteriaceae bacterium]|jgi:murein DD-endopeptidase MepM/ murein hydrolase activator NlpD|nr:peptidoglycan DD-metalloendopeptidase family protein [Propionibacteriaceae bacterium]